MELLFLGTGAADWPDPGPRVGKGRRFSSLLLNQTLLVDCNAMTPAACDEFAVDVNRLTDIVIGHPHGDHYSPDGLMAVAKRRLPSLPPLTLHLNAPTVAELLEQQPDFASTFSVSPYLPGDCICCNGFQITSFLANHFDGVKAAQLFIESDSHETLFYGLDGAWLLRKTFEFLRTRSIDGIIWDSTSGDNDDWRLFEHNNLDMIRLMTKTLRLVGTLKPTTRQFCTHLARSLCPPHEEFAPKLATEGYELAYDGLKTLLNN